MSKLHTSGHGSDPRHRRWLKLAMGLVVVGAVLHLAPSPAQLFSGEPAGLAHRVRPPQLAAEDGAMLHHVHRPRAPLRLPGVRFSFAVVSDLHEKRTCGLGFAPRMAQALQQINRLQPAFVIGLGDLVAGGGDCLSWGKGWPSRNLEKQLQEFDEQVLSKLRVPFVPVAGNHDLTSLGSRDPTYPRDAWTAFWEARRHKVLPAARAGLTAKSQRFSYRGIGFVLAGYYDTFGLHPSELRWLRKHVRPADLVFRHINPYGLSCLNERECGTAIRNWPQRRMELLTNLMHERRVTALFAGHTHSFFDGWCNGLRFINTGSLGTRSMEYLKGWAKSPYRKRQAFVWVDVLTNASMRVTFFTWDAASRSYRPFDNRHFPASLTTKRRMTPYYEEGVAATCVANRRAPAHPAAFFAATARSR